MNFEDFYNNNNLKNYFYYTTYSFFNTSIIKYYMEFEDYHQEQLFAFSRRLKNFDPNRVKIKTFIFTSIKSTHNTIHRNCKSEKNQINNLKNKFFIDQQNGEVNNHEMVSNNYDIELSVDSLINDLTVVLNAEEKEIVRLLYLGYKASEINRLLGFKEQQIKHKINVIRKKLKENIY